MKKTTSFGEILIRLSTQPGLKVSHERHLGLCFGGAELNVTATLAALGLPVSLITKVPDNPLGAAAVSEMQKCGIDASAIVFGGERIGLYFLETGQGIRPGRVTYDRGHSALSTVGAQDFDWEKLLQNANWFHWSGITPAISEAAAKECLKALKVAHRIGIPVSTDLNYRSKLWAYGKPPAQIMPELLYYSHLILGDLQTAYMMLGLPAIETPDYQKTETLLPLYEPIFRKCPHLKTIATTLRYAINASHQKIGGVLVHENQIFTSPVTDLPYVVERIGTGDAFMAGLIYGFQKQLPPERIIHFATACCCLKHTLQGDYAPFSAQEVEDFLGAENRKIAR